MDIKEGSFVRIVAQPSMPKHQRFCVGFVGTVIDVHGVGEQHIYRVHFPSGAVDFLENEIEIVGSSRVGR